MSETRVQNELISERSLERFSYLLSVGELLGYARVSTTDWAAACGT
jgi:hypothetical protein